jgi:hypothetical protein
VIEDLDRELRTITKYGAPRGKKKLEAGVVYVRDMLWDLLNERRLDPHSEE